eukprot:75757_1
MQTTSSSSDTHHHSTTSSSSLVQQQQRPHKPTNFWMPLSSGMDFEDDSEDHHNNQCMLHEPTTAGTSPISFLQQRDSRRNCMEAKGMMALCASRRDDDSGDNDKNELFVLAQKRYQEFCFWPGQE